MITRHAQARTNYLLAHFPAVVITGPRQVGKTTLAKTIRAASDQPSIYLDLENPADLARLAFQPDIFFAENEDKLVILDEVQRMPALFPLLRSMIDLNRRPGRFILLGSASPVLIRDSSESLAGRAAFVELTPFGLLELPAETDFRQHWFRGGFPGAFLATDAQASRDWLRFFIQSYIERDLPMLGLPASPTVTRQLWTILANNQGSVVNFSELGGILGLSALTVTKYVHFLHEAYLLTLLQPWFVHSTKRLTKSPRVYLRDSGVLHQLTAVTDFNHLFGMALLGKSWEGYVIEQIRTHLPPDFELFYYRTHTGTESDLVLVRAGQPVASVEIKFSNTPVLSKGTYIAIEDLKTSKNFVITPENDGFRVAENLLACSLRSFIEVHLPGL